MANFCGEGIFKEVLGDSLVDLENQEKFFVEKYCLLNKEVWDAYSAHLDVWNLHLLWSPIFLDTKQIDSLLKK